MFRSERQRSSTLLRRLMGGALAASLLASGGCVSQQEYDDLYSANKALQDRNVALQQELSERENATSILGDRVRAGDDTLAEAQRRNAELNSQLVRLRENYRLLADRLNDVSAVVIDPATDQRLQDLAARRPNLITYDPSRGMMRFASDLTFASGSVEVQAGARQGLQELANILASPDAQNYDVRIVGHTDNVRVSRAATKRRFPDNLHLSAGRAISVRNVLVSMNVPGDRMQIAGWGEFRPIVENPARGGAAANRRVEIFLTASTRMSAPSGAVTSPATPRPQATAEDFPVK